MDITMALETSTYRCTDTACTARARAFNKVDFIRIDNSVVFAPNFEVVGD